MTKITKAQEFKKLSDEKNNRQTIEEYNTLLNTGDNKETYYSLLGMLKTAAKDGQYNQKFLSNSYWFNKITHDIDRLLYLDGFKVHYNWTRTSAYDKEIHCITISWDDEL